MHAETHGGEGEVVGIGQRDHVEEPAVIRDPHMAEAIAHRRHLPLLHRHLLEQREAVAGEALQQVKLDGGIGQNRRPIGPRKVVGNLGAPEPQIRAPSCAGRGGEIVGREPGGGVAALMALLPADRYYAGIEHDEGGPGLGRKIERIEQPLAVARVAAA